jgi:ATP-dependent exoDNAse (exonuclease V) alpha subunit
MSWIDILADEDISDTLALYVGAKVILVKNLGVKKGLTNGCMGTVRELLWRKGEDPAIDQPHGVMVVFDDHTCPPAPDAPGKRSRWVSIFPVTSYYDSHEDECTRTQFPLELGWTITMHKSQGLTLPNAVRVESDGEDKGAGKPWKWGKSGKSGKGGKGKGKKGKGKGRW